MEKIACLSDLLWVIIPFTFISLVLVLHFLCFFVSFQDDSYVDSYVRTIGFDFVIITLLLLLLLVFMAQQLRLIIFILFFSSKNQNSGAGRENCQATNCEYSQDMNQCLLPTSSFILLCFKENYSTFLTSPFLICWVIGVIYPNFCVHLVRFIYYVLLSGIQLDRSDSGL